MKQKTVTVEIDENGLSTVDLENFQGKGCSKVAAAFRGGDAVKASRTKREFAIEPKQVVRQQQ